MICYSKVQSDGFANLAKRLLTPANAAELAQLGGAKVTIDAMLTYERTYVV